MIDLKAVAWKEARSGEAPYGLFAYEDAGLAGGAALGGALRKTVFDKARAEGFKGKPSECAVVAVHEGGRERRFLVAGLGKKAKSGSDALRKAAGALVRLARKRFERFALIAPGDARTAAEGALLSSYRFNEYRKPDEETRLKEMWVVAERGPAKALEPALERARRTAEAVCLARDLVNRGPSDKTPESMGRAAKALAGGGVSVRIIDQEEARRLGMGAYLSVARGSMAAPCFVHLDYKPKGAKRKVGLVGKGITFDSGGLSLKPPQSMETMKFDMAGAAAVLGVFKALAHLKPKVEVHGFCAFTYNMPGPDATKPGDVAKAMNGKTVEILNTDAEGRLVLADALTYATRQGLDALIDVATLTGAALTALGDRVTAAMTNDKALLAKVQKASRRAGEPLWELPLVEEYKENLKSQVADLRNISTKRGGEAGAIMGGLFLQEFVDGKPWVHLDIAGPAWTEGEGDLGPAGGTGCTVRTLLEYLQAL